MTNKQELWRQYYAAVKRGQKTEAQRLLSLIHTTPANRSSGGRGGCSKCRKRF